MGIDTLDIAPGLSLDADYFAGASAALLGKRGAGKTYACRVLAECLFDAGVQTVVIDPMGTFWGLRASTSGDEGGIPIPVFGGEHGDAPLEPASGALMADLVVEEGLSMVLDLSGFGSRTQERIFVAGFLDRLYRTNRDLVHLIVDEADLFAPQKPRREDAHLLVTMENIVRRGRNRGIGITMASQRAAVLNKDVLTQIDALVALRVAAPQDRDAISEWVRGQGDEETWSRIAPSLPGLANGECWWWIPEHALLQQVQVRKTRTFDSSPTRKRGESGRAPKALADVDLDAISGRIAATIERAKATDPRELTKRIRELEKTLAGRATSGPHPAPEPEVVKIPVLDDALVARLEGAVSLLTTARDAAEAAAGDLLQRARQAAEDFGRSADRITEAADAIAATLTSARNTTTESARAERPARAGTQTPQASAAAARPRAEAPIHTGVTPARQRLLDALRSLENIGVTPAGRTQLALWAGVSPKSSSFTNNLGGLRTAGFIDYPSAGSVALTGDGRALAAPVDQMLTDEDLHHKVQGLVTPSRWRILEALIAAYPDAVSRDVLAEAAGMSASSSSFTNNLGALRSLGLLDYPSPGHVVATGILFVDGS